MNSDGGALGFVFNSTSLSLHCLTIFDNFLACYLFKILAISSMFLAIFTLFMISTAWFNFCVIVIQVEILMKFQADPTIRNNNLESPIDVACQFGHAAVSSICLVLKFMSFHCAIFHFLVMINLILYLILFSSQFAF